MNKFLFVSSAIVTSIVFGQSAFAETNLQLSQDSLKAASQGYLLTNEVERPKSRRSSIFAHIAKSKKDAATTFAKSTPKPVTVAKHATDAAVFVYPGTPAKAEAAVFVYPGTPAKAEAAMFVYPES